MRSRFYGVKRLHMLLTMAGEHLIGQCRLQVTTIDGKDQNKRNHCYFEGPMQKMPQVVLVLTIYHNQSKNNFRK